MAFGFSTGSTPAPPPDPALLAQQQAQQELMAAIAAMTQQASQAQAGADQAGQQYVEAAQTPQAQLNPLAAMAGGLLPDIASIISGNKEYSQRGQHQVKQAKVDLMQRRADNLAALADAYEEKAKAASSLGNKSMELEFKEKQDKVLKQHETVLENMKNKALGEREAQQQTGQTQRETMQQTGLNEREAAGNANELEKQRLQNAGDLAEQRLRNQGSATTAGIRSGVTGGSSSSEDIDFIAKSIESGGSKLHNYKQSMRPAIVKYMAQQGMKIIPEKVRNTIDALGSARAAVDQLKALSEKVNTAEPGLDKVIKGVGNVAGAITETNPDAAELRDQGETMLAFLARAKGEKGNLSDKDIARARKNVPGLFDGKVRAERKIKGLVDLFDEIEKRTIETHTTKLSPGTITMVAPDGGLLHVPNDPAEIKKYVGLGAKRR